MRVGGSIEVVVRLVAEEAELFHPAALRKGGKDAEDRPAADRGLFALQIRIHFRRRRMIERTERIVNRLFLRCAALRRHLASLFPAEFPTALVLFVGLEHRRFVGVLKVFVLIAEFREHLVEERVVVDGLEALVVLVAHQAEDGDFLALVLVRFLHIENGREEAVPFALVFDGADVLVAQRVAVLVDEFDDVVAVLVIVVLSTMLSPSS